MIRTYAPMKQSRGTVIPPRLRIEVLERDGGCVGPRVQMPGDCQGTLELDHVRASHGMGMKSETTAENLVTLCGAHHRVKTNAGRTWRPVLLDYLTGDHSTHVDPCSPECHKQGWLHPTDPRYPFDEVTRDER
jgi:hypothetical protein